MYDAGLTYQDESLEVSQIIKWHNSKVTKKFDISIIKEAVELNLEGFDEGTFVSLVCDLYSEFCDVSANHLAKSL